MKNSGQLSTSVYRAFGSYRFLLALLVAIGHLADLSPDWLREKIIPISLGNVGVMMFFVVSGFVIAEACFVFYTNRPVAFVINRILRIFPPFYAALILSIAIHYALRELLGVVPDTYFSTTNLINNLLVMPILYGGGALKIFPEHQFISYFWAISVELHFYLVAIAIFCAYWKFCAVQNLARLRHVFWVAVTLILTLSSLGWYQWPGRVFYFFSFSPYFIAGVSIYFLAFHGYCKGPILALVLSTCLSLVHFQAYNEGLGGFVPLGLFMANLIAFFLLSRVNLPSRFSGWDRLLGDLSYPLYLNHFIILATMKFLGKISIASYLLSICMAILLAAAMRSIVEPSTNTLRAKIRGAKL